jgi:hypothetical protein
LIGIANDHRRSFDPPLKSATPFAREIIASGRAMNDPKDLREKAEQARRAAGIRTGSGQAADRQLLALAVRLERQADEAEKREAILAKLRP